MRALTSQRYHIVAVYYMWLAFLLQESAICVLIATQGLVEFQLWGEIYISMKTAIIIVVNVLVSVIQSAIGMILTVVWVKSY